VAKSRWQRIRSVNHVFALTLTKKARKDESPESHRALVEAVQVVADVVRRMAGRMDEDK
jgi:hypothetical protein